MYLPYDADERVQAAGAGGENVRTRTQGSPMGFNGIKNGHFIEMVSHSALHLIWKKPPAVAFLVSD